MSWPEFYAWFTPAYLAGLAVVFYAGYGATPNGGHRA